MPPQVSVIVPFRDARSQLPALVEALRRQSCAPETFEVIWVDDASRDRGAEWLQAQLSSGWQLLHHRTPRGAYAARNTGLNAARGETLAFTDVDCRPHPDWIAQGLAAVASVPRVAGRVHLELSAPLNSVELVDAGRFFRQQRYVQEGFGATANLFVRRSVFDTVGPFDERLRSGGDYEFGQRCSRAGISIAYAEHVVVDHSARGSVRELLSKCERVGFGTGQLIRRGGIPIGALAARASDRLAIARRRGASERRIPAADRTRSLAMTGLHSLVLLATAVGTLRGFLFPGASAAHSEHHRLKVDAP